jgi:hypothetical protein
MLGNRTVWMQWDERKIELIGFDLDSPIGIPLPTESDTFHAWACARCHNDLVIGKHVISVLLIESSRDSQFVHILLANYSEIPKG